MATQTMLSMLKSCVLGEWPRDAEDLADTSGTDHGDDESDDMGKSGKGAASIGDTNDSDNPGAGRRTERIRPMDFGVGLAQGIMDIDGVSISTHASASSDTGHASVTGDNNVVGNRSDVGRGSACVGPAARGGGVAT